jgi:iron(III) transport system substrate-binding protein
LACAPAAPTPASPATEKPVAAPKAEQPSAAKAGQPAAAKVDKPAAAAKPAADPMAQLAEAARQEGSVVIFGPPGESSRVGFGEAFEKAYPGVKVSFEGAMGPAHFPKMVEADKAGRSIVDVFISGPEPGLTMKRSGMFQELDPLIVAPDIKDGSKWWQGKLDYIDKEGKFFLAFWGFPQETFFYNADQLKETDLSSWKGLLDPKFKGKMAIWDPTIPGFTQPKLNHFLNEPSLGESYVRSLLSPATEISITRDDRQMAESVARGVYTIGIGASWTTAAPIAQAFPVLKVFPAERIEEGTVFTSGFGNVAVLKSPPHPNAAKLYLNWLLSRDAQTALTAVSGYESGRTDVPNGPVPEVTRRNPRIKGFVEYHEEIVAKRARAVEVAKEALGR